jgi:hypothetical protein
VKAHPNNPREIKEEKLAKLITSIEEFPDMINKRPLIINAAGEVIGGNMRLAALQEIGAKTVPCIRVDWNEARQREFMIKDNTSAGQWDWDELSNNWDSDELQDWGMNVWQAPEEVDYSAMDDADDDTDAETDDMMNGVRKAIQIEFEPEHYEAAKQLVSEARAKGTYIGQILTEALKASGGN